MCSSDLETVVFLLDEFAVMIDEMAHLDARREDARLLLRWLRQLRQPPRIKNVRFWWPDRSASGVSSAISGKARP